ncbi:MAG: hypothetical protein A2W93_01515 [Bacteroidetes bacterium GWF2_43_63]|nr:MAG: hypothetical protein A2W94_10555 [Bacteroidetes bacterium GWE2_42_42]OFY55867.1 MAG: hypothetical protein A2W93_01515 [Bacteroidetes bacterium GWF2_43_63]HBG71339.1 ATPase [Bacteroidales bacterium]HCB60441.1 ATPase [Bacteroidales bacterium]HCY22602.1 ATPase [Bacteroidales bacterium]
MHDAIRIAVTGPESTGKSTLAEYLAAKFGGVSVPEYAREYLEKLGREYNFDDILKIAQQQILNEDNAAIENKLVFCDTELLVTKIWCDDKFGHCHSWIIDELNKRKYDLVLLCNIDLPWEPDPQREDPHRREHLMTLYQEQVVEYYGNVAEVIGEGEDRLQFASKIVEELLRNKSCL